MPQKYVMGDMTFDTDRRRDRSRTQIANEASNRGLIPESFTADYSTGPQLTSGLWPAGVWVISGAPVPSLRCCYWHPSEAVVDKAADDLRAWLDQNGKVDGYVGTVTQD